jgi:malonyl-CoA O-methyltransferase
LDLLNLPRLDKQAVKNSFNRAAKSYDNAAILQEELLSRLLERLQYVRHQPETILDVGCGTGKGVRGLQKAYPQARVCGADIAYQMLLQARSSFRLLSRKRLVTADMEQLPFAAQTFDLVFSSLALQWCARIEPRGVADVLQFRSRDAAGACRQLAGTRRSPACASIRRYARCR